MIQYFPLVTGSLTVNGNVIVSGSIFTSGSILISGSVASASYAATLEGLGSASFAPAAAFNTVSQSYASASGSLSTRVSNLETTASVLTTASASFATVSSSFSSTSQSVSSRVTLIEGQYATTGSNTFTGTQYISQASNAISFTSTASLYTDGGLRVQKDFYVSGNAYFKNVTVYGTSSIEYITSSNLNISDNIISVNTFTPAIRFGGLAVYDSGSTGLTGSMLWDSEKDRWVYSNPSGSTYDGGMMISGPRNTSGLGNEVGTTACAVMIGQGADHITSSGIFSYANATCFYGNSFISASGTACFSGQVCAAGNLLLGGAGTTNIVPKYTAAGTLGVSQISTYGTNGQNVNLGWNTCARVGFDNDGTGTYFYGLELDNGTRRLNIIGKAPDGNAGVGIWTGTTTYTQRFNINADGIACFACRVCVPSLTAAGTITTTASPGAYEANLTYLGTTYNLGASEVSDTIDFKICGASASTTGNGFAFWTQPGNTTPSQRFRIDKNGIACFACQVCSPFFAFTSAVPATAASTGYLDYSGGGARLFSVGTSGATKGTFSVYLKGADDSSIIPFSLLNNGIACFSCGVGIGTGTVPNSSNYNMLRINGSTGGELSLAGGGTEYGYMYANSGIVVLASQVNIPLVFQTNAISRARIAGNGEVSFCCSVAIGTSTPNTSLEVRGTGNTALNTAGNLFVADGGTATQAAGEGGQISFGAWLNGDLSKPYPLGAIKGISESGTTNFNTGALLFGTMDSNTAVQERMRINGCGNVGIGTNTPTALLHNFRSCNSESNIYIENTCTGTGAGSSLYLVENSSTFSPAYGQLTHFNSGYSTNGLLAANRTWLSNSGAELLIGTRTAHSIILHTGGFSAGCEKMRISAAGQVTMACQPSFKAYITGANPTGTKGTWNAVPYNATDWNVGGCFNTSTDNFTAPVSGKYLFTYQLNVYSLDDTAQLQLAFYLNNSSYRYYFLMANLPTGNTGDTNVSVSDILNLSAGDTVQARVYTDGSGTFYYSGGLSWNSFSGHLLG